MDKVIADAVVSGMVITDMVIAVTVRADMVATGVVIVDMDTAYKRSPAWLSLMQSIYT